MAIELISPTNGESFSFWPKIGLTFNWSGGGDADFYIKKGSDDWILYSTGSYPDGEHIYPWSGTLINIVGFDYFAIGVTYQWKIVRGEETAGPWSFTLSTIDHFRNIQDGGNWIQGGTYTFEVWEPEKQTAGSYTAWNPLSGTCDVGLGDTLHVGIEHGSDAGFYEAHCGYDPQQVGDGNIIFDNSNENLSGGVAGTPKIDGPVDTGDGWNQYTITIPIDCPLGIAYLKSVSRTYATYVG